ncbi:glycosyltransferase family 2 protein [Bacillus sp. EB600]|uniref:glycosyltransferase family 2 protein n=1 Tax=Bacillus sp. EB600 TaxID=2806345 RepID=UPI00210BB76E|nr:glycosyltransferase family 2 protein [Bacillus sp. EB600]MCQ6278888.1 glycosyltransferase family 2 protein [Bacillus sp. EB600]
MVPKVSVIIPVYNCEKYLSKCLDSVLEQTHPNLEIIIVNDGSTDESESIIIEYKKKHKEIIYFYQENKGPSEARNKAIANANGEYIVFVDADDTVNEYYIEKLLKEMVSTNSDLVCCGYKDISIYGVHYHTDFNFKRKISLHYFLEMVCEGTGGVLWGKIYKREIIQNNNIRLDKNIFMSEDLIFVLKYAIHSKSFSTVQEYLYIYNRLNQTSISSNISIDYLENYISVCRFIEKILNSTGLNKNRIKKLMTKKIQDVVFTLVDQQGKNLKVIGLEAAIENVKIILSISYIQKYKEDFTSNDLYSIPYLFLIKGNFVKICIFYAAFINTLKSFKNKLTRRKKVGL